MDHDGPGAGRTQVLLAGQPNFRTLAGLPAAGGRRVRPGVLYRSGELSHLDDTDVAALAGLDLHAVVDLRSDAEVAERGPDRLPDGVGGVRLPIAQADALRKMLTDRFSAGDFGPPETDPMPEVYRSLVRDWMSAFGSFLDVVVDAGAGPVVVHCTHGKDRAGIACALLLTALGVPWDAVLADFLESNRRRAAEVERDMQLFRSMAPEAETVDTEWMRRLLVVERGYLEAAWSEIERIHGSTEGLLVDGLGLTPQRLARLRDTLLA